MTRPLTFLLLIMSSFLSYSQESKKDSIDYNSIFTDPEILPEFPGGYLEFYCFLDSSLNKDLLNNIPPNELSYASFTIDTLGFVKNISIEKGNNEILNNELIRVIKNSPQWKPGGVYINGKFTAKECRYTLPLKTPYKSNCDK